MLFWNWIPLSIVILNLFKLILVFKIRDLIVLTNTREGAMTEVFRRTKNYFQRSFKIPIYLRSSSSLGFFDQESADQPSSPRNSWRRYGSGFTRIHPDLANLPRLDNHLDWLILHLFDSRFDVGHNLSQFPLFVMVSRDGDLIIV